MPDISGEILSGINPTYLRIASSYRCAGGNGWSPGRRGAGGTGGSLAQLQKETGGLFRWGLIFRPISISSAAGSGRPICRQSLGDAIDQFRVVGKVRMPSFRIASCSGVGADFAIRQSGDREQIDFGHGRQLRRAVCRGCRTEAI